MRQRQRELGLGLALHSADKIELCAVLCVCVIIARAFCGGKGGWQRVAGSQSVSQPQQQQHHHHPNLESQVENVHANGMQSERNNSNKSS